MQVLNNVPGMKRRRICHIIIQCVAKRPITLIITLSKRNICLHIVFEQSEYIVYECVYVRIVHMYCMCTHTCTFAHADTRKTDLIWHYCTCVLRHYSLLSAGVFVPLFTRQWLQLLQVG